MEHKYGMRLRGFSPGCQPMKGLIRREDDPTGRYHDILVYSRSLSDSEINSYELDIFERKENNVQKATFNQWLEAVVGITPAYFDNNYSGTSAQELYDEYDYYWSHPEEYADYFK